MFDLLRRFWDRAVSEGGVIQGAPFTFIVAVLVSAGFCALVIWQALDWRYGSIIANRDASINARDSQISLLAAQVKDLTDKYDELKKNVPEAKQIDPDSISQRGEVVGKAIGALPDKSKSKVFFRLLNTNGDFDRTKTFQYRDMRLKIDSVSGEARSSMAGEVRAQFVDVVCTMLDGD